MAIKRCTAEINVVEAARIRIKNIFRNGLPVFFSFSAGKDSLVLAHLLLEMIQRGEISPGQLSVHFIDEEAIYPCIEETALAWRKKFLMVGATFFWYCIEVRHFNCFNSLENDESFICWDSQKENLWIRRPPSFAIREHPLLRPRKDTYQDFMHRMYKKGINITGIRTAESVQRLSYIATMTSAKSKITKNNTMFPVYDWRDSDVWLYLHENDVDIPKVYLYLWQTGHGRRGLRVSQFFSSDTARSLVKMREYYPDLMERIIRREPNAYLAALYWNSEMFGRSSQKRKELESGAAPKDYKAELTKMFNNIDAYFTTPAKRKVADRYRRLFIRVSLIATAETFEDMYEGLIKGDPKLRTLRAIFKNVHVQYSIDVRKELGMKLRG